MRTEILYTRTRNVAEWAQANARGEVPGRLLYSLDILETFGFELTARAPVRSSLITRGINRAGAGLEWWEQLRDPLMGKADLAISWSESCGIPAALASRRPPVITGAIWVTETSFAMNPALRHVVRRGLQRADAVWALSAAQLPILVERFGVPQRRVHYVPFGIDVNFWSGEPAREPYLIVGVGNDRHRDHRCMIEAMRRVSAAMPRAELELVTRQPGLRSDHVRVHAHLSHLRLRDLYCRASLFALATVPNKHVSGMTALLEASAMGLPVVATRTDGIADYVIDGQTGILVPPGDAAALAEAIIELLMDSDHARSLGQAAAKFVRREHSAEIQARAIAELARSVL